MNYQSNFNNKRVKSAQLLNKRIWSQKRNLKGLDLFKEVDKKSILCDKAYELLFDIDDDLINDLGYKRDSKKNRKKSQYSQPISKKCEKLLNNIYSKINFMKNESKELNKLNSLSFQKASKNYFRTNRPKSSIIFDNNKKYNKRAQTASTNYYSQTSVNISNKDKNIKTSMLKKMKDLNNSTSNYNQSNIITGCTTDNNNCVKIINRFDNKSFNTFRNKCLSNQNNKIKKQNYLNSVDIFTDKEEEKFRKLQDIDIQKLYKSNKNKKVNLSRLNDNYRIQINKSFGKYKADNHLKELNKIQLNDMSVRQEMENFKFKLNEKINDCCTGKFYKKEYEKLKNFNKTQQNIDIFSDDDFNFPDKLPFHILLNSQKENTKIFPNGFKIRALYEYQKNKNKKNSTKKIKSDSNNSGINSINKELLLIEKALKKLKNGLNIEPIIKYIDGVKDEKTNKDKNVFSEREKTYFPCFDEADNYLRKMIARKKSSKLNLIMKTKTQEKAEVWDKIQEITKQIKEISKPNENEGNDEIGEKNEKNEESESNNVN